MDAPLFYYTPLPESRRVSLGPGAIFNHNISDRLMDALIETLQHTEFFSTLFLCCLLLFIGAKIGGNDPRSITVGKVLGYVSFLGYCAVAICHFTPAHPAQIAAIIIRALLLTGIVVGTAWILTPLLRIVLGARDRIAAARRQRQLDAAHRRVQAERALEEQERRRDESERRRRQLELDQETKERLRKQRNIDEQNKCRRVAARAQCERLYRLCKHVIASRFDQAALDEWMRKYMADDQPPDVVEKHGEQLCGIIEQHRHEVGAPKQGSAIGLVTEWFLAEQARIESLPLDRRMKDELLRHLKIRYMKLAQDALKTAAP
jgi:hypothetical protein